MRREHVLRYGNSLDIEVLLNHRWFLFYLFLFVFVYVISACSPTCATCKEKNKCISCLVGHLMEDEKCVQSCSNGYYQLSISRCSGKY